MALVGGHTFGICGSDAGDHESFVDINATTDRWHTYLCLKRQSTHIIIRSLCKQSSPLTSPVICSIPKSLWLDYKIKIRPKLTFFITFCALSEAKGMDIIMEIINSEKIILQQHLFKLEYDVLVGKYKMTEMMFDILMQKLSKLECDDALMRMFDAFPDFTNSMIEVVENLPDSDD